jgi:DNA-binding XRE family transcriptional regulator
MGGYHNCGQGSQHEPVSRRPSRSRRADTPRVVFGGVLRRLRSEQGYSQDTFAHRSGYHRNYIGLLERGQKSPSLNALFDFANALGVRPSEILKSVEEQVGTKR